MEIIAVIKEYIENRLLDIQDETGLNFILCSQSKYSTLHACLSRNIEEIRYLDDQEIEEGLKDYFRVDACFDGEVYFNLLPEDWDLLEKLKIQSILS